MKRIVIFLAIFVAACSGGGSSGGSAVNGKLSFNQTSYQVLADATTEVLLDLSNLSSPHY
jgi:hypothetical protein